MNQVQHTNPDGSVVTIWKADSASIGARASIGERARIGERASIGAGASIGERASIGEWACIGAGASIGERARIGEWACIGAGASIGEWACIGAGARIGEWATFVRFLGYSPNNYAITLNRRKTGEYVLNVGCREFTIAEGRAYWTNHRRRTVMLAVCDYAVVIIQTLEVVNV